MSAVVAILHVTSYSLSLSLSLIELKRGERRNKRELLISMFSTKLGSEALCYYQPGCELTPY